MTKKVQKGFSLIELLVVVVIVVALAAIAISVVGGGGGQGVTTGTFSDVFETRILGRKEARLTKIGVTESYKVSVRKDDVGTFQFLSANVGKQIKCNSDGPFFMWPDSGKFYVSGCTLVEQPANK